MITISDKIEILKYIFKKIQDPNQRTCTRTQLRIKAEETFKEIQNDIEKNRYKYTFNKLLEFSKISNALIQNIIAMSTSKTNDDSRNKSSDFSTNSSEDKNINLTLLTTSRLSFKLLAQIIFVLLKLHKKSKMAPFNLKDASAIVPLFNGSADQVKSFLRAIHFAKKCSRQIRRKH